MFHQNLNRIVSKPNVRADPVLHTDSIPIELISKENFPTDTQVWNRLSHRNDCQKRGAIRVTYRCVLGQEHQSSGGQVFHHVHGLGWLVN